MLFSNRVRATIADGADVLTVFSSDVRILITLAGAAFTTEGNVDADRPKKGAPDASGRGGREDFWAGRRCRVSDWCVQG
jgi:hypothetical protein